MFENAKYKKLSSDAKLTYALLYDRLSLSKLNGWINEDDEVFLIYTRQAVAEDLGISYRKAISAFKELIGAKLIKEQRCGRGIPNKIYIVKLEINKEQTKEYVKNKNSRTVPIICTELREEIKTYQTRTPENDVDFSDMPNGNVKNFQNGISKCADLEYLDMPKSHTNHTNINKTYNNHTNYSQSVIAPGVDK